MRKTFDDIIRRRWEGQQFPIDEGHRQQMIGLLEGKKKRRAFPLWWWGAGAVVLIAGYILWQTSTIPTQPPTGQPHAADVIENANGVSIASVNTTNVDPSTTHAVTETTRENAITTDDQSYPNLGDGLVPTGNSNSTGSTTKPLKSSPIQNSTSSHKRADRNEREQRGFTHQQSSPSSSPTSVIKNEEVRAGDKHDQDKSVQSVSGNENIALTTISVSEPVLTSSAIGTTPPARAMLSTAWLEALPIEELLINTDHQVGLIKPDRRIKHPLYAFTEAGVGAILGSQPKYPSGWKVNAGAGIGYLVKSKLHLMLSGGYLMQDGGLDFERTSTLSSLGFATRSQINRLKPDRLHYVYGRLGLQYRIKKHHIGGSVETQWLYGAQGVINIHTDDGLTGPSESSRNAWLNLNGLNRWQYNAGVQYGYRLTPYLNVSAGTQCYFTSLTRQDPALRAEGFNWKGNTAKVQPFITFNYLLYGPF